MGKKKEERLERLLEWVVNNPDLAEKEYPEFVEELKDRIVKRDSFETALIIQDIPKGFLHRKSNNLKLAGLTQEKNIRLNIDMINSALMFEQGDTIEKSAVESVKPELLQERAYWISLLNEDFSLGDEKLGLKREKGTEKYLEVGSLFAQGLIYKKKVIGVGYKYCYNKKRFDSPNQLATYLEKVVLKSGARIKNYVSDTFYETDRSLCKKIRANKIIAYCKEKHIQVVNEFLDKIVD